MVEWILTYELVKRVVIGALLANIASSASCEGAPPCDATDTAEDCQDTALLGDTGDTDPHDTDTSDTDPLDSDAFDTDPLDTDGFDSDAADTDTADTDPLP